MLGILRWNGRASVTFHQIIRKASLPLELGVNPSRWLIVRPKLNTWIYSGGCLGIQSPVSQGARERIVAKIIKRLNKEGAAYEII